ncbi:hypothetical protein F6J84_08285 [Microbacterium caowuchunii]|uniref:hypothetical protein n=1 Tax=Microbacterium caowuchunii TaxID=2614638 RepID=UPI001243CE35|nr:hypothetical protein [Microbacterium caowuchunii]QEW00096.1 hypothetical protein F6J84_08285 [Microbacterium caowuchunii]
MTPLTSTAPLLALLDEPVLRVLPADRGPYEGEVIAVADGPAVRLRQGDAMTAHLWDAAGEHVAELCDVHLCPEGVAAVVPLCTVGLVELAAQRYAADDPLRAGEVVTLAVSVLRGGVSEFQEHAGRTCRGEWWLADDGMPLFVHGPSGSDPFTAGIEALEACGNGHPGDGPLAGALSHAAAALGDPERLAHAVASAEERLFALGPAEPVLALPRARRAGRAGMSVLQTMPEERQRSWLRWADAADAGIAEMISGALTAAWASIRRARAVRPTGRRRGAVLVAGAAAALVLALGMLWPTGEPDGEPASAERTAPLPEVPADPEDAAAPSGEDAAGPAGGTAVPEEDVVVATTALLEGFRACGADAACRVALQDHDAVISVDGAAFAPPDTRALTLMDDVGGLALLRADDTGGGRVPQIVTVLRVEEKWVLRDIHDVAQHPG